MLTLHWSEVKVTQSCTTLCYIVHGILSGRIAGVGSVSLLQGSSQCRSPALQRDSLPTKPQKKPIYIDSRTFHLAKLKFCICWTSPYFSSLPTLKPLATTIMLSASISLIHILEPYSILYEYLFHLIQYPQISSLL